MTAPSIDAAYTAPARRGHKGHAGREVHKGSGKTVLLQLMDTANMAWHACSLQHIQSRTWMTQPASTTWALLMCLREGLGAVQPGPTPVV